MSDTDRVYAAERILKKRKNREGKMEYYVKWKDWSLKHSTWEPEQNILDIRLIESFEAEASAKKRGPKKKDTAKRGRETLKTRNVPKIEQKILSTTRRNRRALPLPDDDSNSDSERIAEQAGSQSNMIDDSSSGTDDLPISTRVDTSGRKRKAEILSKESGKIGVTITTSDSKVARIPPSSLVNNNSVTDEKKGEKSEECKNDRDVSTKQVIKRIFTSPGPEFWMRRNPVANQIFITDVTVNTETVTIRECKTEEGFFRSRDSSNKEQLAQKLDDLITKDDVPLSRIKK